MGLPTISFDMQSLKHDTKLFIGAHTSNTTQSTFMEDGKITAYEFLAAGLLTFYSISWLCHKLFSGGLRIQMPNLDLVWISATFCNLIFFNIVSYYRQKGDPKVLGGALPADNQYLRLNNIPCRCRSRDIESIQKEVDLEDCRLVGEDVPETAPPAASSGAGDDEEEEEFYSFTDGDSSVFNLLFFAF